MQVHWDFPVFVQIQSGVPNGECYFDSIAITHQICSVFKIITDSLSIYRFSCSIWHHSIWCQSTYQGFPNSIKGWRELEILLGRIFFIGWWEPEEKWFWPFKPFPKLKTTFCKYWKLIKIKISMTCLYKEYEVKIKMVQEQWL